MEPEREGEHNQLAYVRVLEDLLHEYLYKILLLLGYVQLAHTYVSQF